MPNWNLIPFGLHEETGRFTDIADVPRGKTCGCVCPCCHAPLIAKHGTVKEWHFAHQSRDEEAKTDSACEYAYFTSVRLMLKQLFDQPVEFQTPQLLGELIIPDEYGWPQKYHFKVTDSKVLELKDVEVDSLTDGHIFDFVASFGQSQLGVFLTYPSRPLPFSSTEFEGSKTGVIVLDLQAMPLLMQHSGNSHPPSYLNGLLSYLATSVVGKSWLYHPRYAASIERAEKYYRENPTPTPMPDFESEQAAKFYAASLLKESKGREVRCLCRTCQSKWVGRLPGKNVCTKCSTHLFVTEFDSSVHDDS